MKLKLLCIYFCTLPVLTLSMAEVRVSGLSVWGNNVKVSGEDQYYALSFSTAFGKPLRGIFTIARPPKKPYYDMVKDEHLALLYSLVHAQIDNVGDPQDVINQLTKWNYKLPEQEAKEQAGGKKN